LPGRGGDEDGLKAIGGWEAVSGVGLRLPIYGSGRVRCSTKPFPFANPATPRRRPLSRPLSPRPPIMRPSLRRSRQGFGQPAGAGAMLVACRLAGLSALETYYADVDAHAQLLTTSRPARAPAARSRS